MPESANKNRLPHETAALDGIVVLDFSHVMAGPFATYYLAALGARVIKIENPKRGDALRSKPRTFAAFNHGKEVLQIDLSTPAGQDEVAKLFEQADVVVDNMRPGVMESFGFGEAQLRAVKPSLIHCSISAYGRKGPWAQRPAYDHVIQAASGMTLTAGEVGDDPIKVGFPVIDCATGILGAFGILAAIRRRDMTGAGESIDASMLGAAFQLMYPQTVEVMETDVPPIRRGNKGFSGSPGAETLMCRDGRIALGANTPQQMRLLAKVLGIEEKINFLLKDQSHGFVGGENSETIRELLSSAVSKESAIDLEQRLNSVKVPAAMVRDIAQAVKDGIKNDAIDTWILNDQEKTKVPGLGFRAKTLFSGKDRP